MSALDFGRFDKWLKLTPFYGVDVVSITVPAATSEDTCYLIIRNNREALKYMPLFITKDKEKNYGRTLERINI